MASIKRDLKQLHWEHGNDGQKKVNLEDVVTLVNRWGRAVKDEKMLKRNEQRFQDILNQEEPLSKNEVQEAFDLVIFIHKPLIKGYNDVMGVRLKDADYLRLQNKIIGLPVENGIEELNQKIELYEKKERQKEADKKAKIKAEAEFNKLIQM